MMATETSIAFAHNNHLQMATSFEKPYHTSFNHRCDPEKNSQLASIEHEHAQMDMLITYSIEMWLMHEYINFNVIAPPHLSPSP